MTNTQTWRGSYISRRLFNLHGVWRATWPFVLCALGMSGSVCAEIVQPAIVTRDQSEIFDFSSSENKEPREILQKGAVVFVHLKTGIKTKNTNVDQTYFVVTSTSGWRGYIPFEDVEVTPNPDPYTDFFLQNILSEMPFKIAIDKAKRLNRRQQEQLVLTLPKISWLFHRQIEQACQTMVALKLSGPMVLRHAARAYNCSAEELETIAGSPEGVLKVMSDVPSNNRVRMMRDLKISFEAAWPFLTAAVKDVNQGLPVEAADLLLAQLKTASEKEKRDVILFFTECLGDPNPTARRVACMVFRDPRIDPSSATVALELAGRDKDPFVRENALAALDRMNKVHPRPPLSLMENKQ